MYFLMDSLPIILLLGGLTLIAIFFTLVFKVFRRNPAFIGKCKDLIALTMVSVLAYVSYALVFLSINLNQNVSSFFLISGAILMGFVAYLSFRTLNELKFMETEHNRVQANEQRLSTILDNCVEGIITFDEVGKIESFNDAAQKLFCYSEEEVLGKEITLLILPPDERDRRDGYLAHFMKLEIMRIIGTEGELTGKHRDGATFPLSIKIGLMMLGNARHYTALVADISERKALVKNLQHMAEHDGLTGLFNRSYFQTELARVVERVGRSKQNSCALLYIDLDNFKYINDTLGHAAGDCLLIEIAGLLTKRVRKSDLVTRLGGDEFTIILYNADAAMAVEVAEAFRKRITEHVFRFEAERLDIGCSIGVAMLDFETKSAAEALSRADLACHLAKRSGRNRIHLFNPVDEADMTTMSLDIGWSSRIKAAITANRFALACQPIVNTQTREVDCYEVLIRMLDEKNNLIMPNGFLPSAERFGLAVEIDKWVIVNAITTLAEQRKDDHNLRYAINLSGQTLSDMSVCDLIFETLNKTKLDPSAMTFEVTETVAIADIAQAQSFLSKLQNLGCKTSLDDFGCGFSSFAYLKDLPVDIVKLDGRFVKNMVTNEIDQAMIQAMNNIAHVLGKQTVAEFVETEDALKLLKLYGVDFVQGYHLGRPNVVLPCEAIAANAGATALCIG